MKSIRCLKCLLSLCMLCQPWLALADWEKVDENHLAVVYIDPDKIRASSVFPQAWHLIDLIDKAKTGAQSRLVLMEYDCHEYRRRSLAFASKSEPMGEGKTLFTSTQSTSWKPVGGDTVGEKVIEMLCGHHAKPPSKGKGKDDKAAPAGHGDGHGDAHGAPPAKDAHGEAKPSH